MFVVLQRHAVVGSCYYIGLHHETVFLSLWCISHSSITVCNGCKLQNPVDDLQKRVSSSKDESKSIVWSSKVFLSMKVKSFEPVFIETDFSGRASQSLINWRQRYLPRMAFRELESKKAQDAENAPLLQSQRVTSSTSFRSSCNNSWRAEKCRHAKYLQYCNAILSITVQQNIPP